MTDYKQKYLKYKEKYIQLKNKFDNDDNNNNYIINLKKIYPSTEFHNDNKKYGDNHTTYGEITYDGIEALKTHMKNYKYFMDIGSGNGKFPLYMAGDNNILTSVGIELVEIRHNRAIELKNKLTEEFNNITNKVKLINADFRNVDFKQVLNNNNQPVIIFISNLCFSPEINNELYKKIKAELPSGSIIFSSKEINTLTKAQSIPCPMSWSSSSSVFMLVL